VALSWNAVGVLWVVYATTSHKELLAVVWVAAMCSVVTVMEDAGNLHHLRLQFHHHLQIN